MTVLLLSRIHSGNSFFDVERLGAKSFLHVQQNELLALPQDLLTTYGLTRADDWPLPTLSLPFPYFARQ
jgi:hypothetical protein